MRYFCHIGFCLLSFITTYSQVQIGDDINGGNLYDYCGRTVALTADGSFVAVGALGAPTAGEFPTGAVRLYQKNQNNWVQVGNDLTGLSSGSDFGCSISISEDGLKVAVGSDAYGNYNGLVQVFQNNGNNWIPLGNAISGEALGDYSGIAVSLSSDGSILAIGANRNFGNGNANSGHVRVYQINSGIWTKIGNDIDGEAMNDYSGSGVALSSDGTIVAIGAPNNSGNGLGSGQVRVFRNMDNSWIQIGNDIDGEAPNDNSGAYISLSGNGDILAIGAERNDNVLGINTGHVRVYQNIAGAWVQIGNDINGVYKVSLSSNGQILAAGSINSLENGSSGTAKLYQRVSNNWIQIGANISGENFGDYSTTGLSLSADASTIAVGSPNNDAGYVRLFDLTAILATQNIQKNSAALAPNPAITFFEIDSGEAIKKVELYSVIGQLIKIFDAQSRYLVSDLSAGSYFVKIFTQSNILFKRLLKE